MLIIRFMRSRFGLVSASSLSGKTFDIRHKTQQRDSKNTNDIHMYVNILVCDGES